ncbi:MAG TPA: GNAT family N-acetyltransferase [Terriglobales bacterium]|nr:GNAT family N-acetyltransferase [Terriglobales bacterium]
MIRIRNAESVADIAAARALFTEYADSLGFSLCFQGFDQELTHLPGDYAPPRGRLLLAEVDGDLAGCAALHGFGPAEQRTGEMKRLFVRPGFRGRGVGKELMDSVLAAAREIGYQRVVLDTVRGKMDTAIAMYRAYGFREVANYCENPVEGVLYMELELGAANARAISPTS